MKHPADIGRSIADVSVANGGFIEVRVISIFVLGVVEGTVLDQNKNTALSQ